MLADDTLDELVGWSVEGVIAVFRPAETGWCAQVGYRVVYGKHHKGWSYEPD